MQAWKKLDKWWGITGKAVACPGLLGVVCSYGSSFPALFLCMSSYPHIWLVNTRQRRSKKRERTRVWKLALRIYLDSILLLFNCVGHYLITCPPRATTFLVCVPDIKRMILADLVHSAKVQGVFISHPHQQSPYWQKDNAPYYEKSWIKRRQLVESWPGSLTKITTSLWIEQARMVA